MAVRRRRAREEGEEQGSPREGFAPFVVGLDELVEGGIPRGSWVSVYGPPGSYKTLHALAWCLAGLEAGVSCVYVSTEMSAQQLERQMQKLGWSWGDAYRVYFTNKLPDSQDYGSYDVVLIDMDSLYWWALKLNRLVSEEGKKRERQKRYWYDDPTVLTHAIIIALEAVGSVSVKTEETDYREIEYLRLSVENDAAVKAPARVVVDSVSPYFVARYSVAGRILTWMRMRLSHPKITYLLTSHVSKTREEELGAEIGHIMDGRIKLWMEEPSRPGEEAVNYGFIAKMRETRHSRRVHEVRVEESEGGYVLSWGE